MQNLNEIDKPPILPDFLSLPFKAMPKKLHAKLLVLFLNRILSDQIQNGELDFLENKKLRVSVKDMGIQYNIGLQNKILVATCEQHDCDIQIQALAYDFLQLASRQQDPDTLVFQRRLVMQGNTELGLELKNFLDGLDIESSIKFLKIESFLTKTLPIYQRLFS